MVAVFAVLVCAHAAMVTVGEASAWGTAEPMFADSCHSVGNCTVAQLALFHPRAGATRVQALPA